MVWQDNVVYNLNEEILNCNVSAMKSTNLSIELLRAFITVIEVKSFTVAATLLGRTQPAVSLQLQRLEQLIGSKLITREGREMVLTEQGVALAAHAKRILRLNDLAVSQFMPQKQRIVVFTHLNPRCLI